MFVGLVEIISRLDKPGFVNLRKAFRRISDVWENAKTKNMEKCRLYLSPITQQFLDFTHRLLGFRFVFSLRDSGNDL